jgi:hypothetical protein
MGDIRGMEPCHHQQVKRHAQLRHQPRSTPLWVDDPDDWALVRQQPRPPLVCPEPGCQVELISSRSTSHVTIGQPTVEVAALRVLSTNG